MPKLPPLRETGVYAIINTKNWKRYIGSASKSFTSRKQSHYAKLRRGKHFNPHLQSAWKHYGEAAFEFRILVRCPPHDCIRLEQHYISSWRSFEREFGYNQSPTAGSPLGVKRRPETLVKVRAHLARVTEMLRGKKLSAEHRAKIGEASRKRVRSAKWRENLSKAGRGKVISVEQRAKMSASHKARWKRIKEEKALQCKVSAGLLGITDGH